MRPLSVLAPALLLVTLACARPELDAFRQRPAPLAVTFQVEEPEGSAVASEYAAALRLRLASRTWVVPEGTPPPADAASLKVQVIRTPREAGSPADPAKVGLATGVAVGMLSSLSGNRHGFFDGLFWGLWTAGRVAEDQRHERRAWRISPNRVEGLVRLQLSGHEAPLLEFDVSPQEVLSAMDPLKPSEQEDPARVREEEARAFARVVVQRLSREFGWTLTQRQLWYGSTPEREAVRD